MVRDENTAASGPRQIHLAADEDLLVRWPAPDDVQQSKTEGEQLCLWKIRPGSVVVEGQFTIRRTSGELREAVIEVEPRLRLLPGLASGPIGKLVEQDDEHRIRINLSRPRRRPSYD